MGLFIGVDCGGTSTKALVAKSDGQIVGYGSSGPSNYQVWGPAKAASAIHNAIEKACSNVLREIEMICIGASGAGRSNEQETLKRNLVQLLGISNIFVVNDAQIALIGGTSGQPGVVLIAGTGSISLGMNEYGETARSGGWGYLLGDEGGAFDIGRHGIIAAMHSFDGRGSQTVLSEKILAHFGLKSDEFWRIIPKVYQEENGRQMIAGFASQVTEAAVNGDLAALRIVRRAGRELAIAVRAVIRNLNLVKVPVIITGGVLNNSPIIVESFIQWLHKLAPGFPVKRPDYPPVVGALLSAFNQANQVIDSTVLQRITTTLPENLQINLEN